MDINNRSTIVSNVDNCLWMAKYTGKGFALVPGADPICGKRVPGAAVAAS
jgi:branched-chain amino acid transport system substrate-binding protein